MRAVKWIVGIALVVLLGGFLSFYLPSRDIVRIVDTEVVRMDATTTDNEGVRVTFNRDVRFINAVWPDGAARVYRNEDTGWGWPPYFKFDSANLHAEAQSLTSTDDDPVWVIVRHYGWRIPIFSMFPNATSISRAEGPDQRLIPWFNMVLLTLLVVGAGILWRLLRIGVARVRGRRAR